MPFVFDHRWLPSVELLFPARKKVTYTQRELPLTKSPLKEQRQSQEQTADRFRGQPPTSKTPGETRQGVFFLKRPGTVSSPGAFSPAHLKWNFRTEECSWENERSQHTPK